jgi:CBS domain-containing protein
MPVGDYCRRPAQTAAPSETLRAAARRMQAEGVGTLVVVEEGRVRGIVTDRDLALRCLGEGLDPDTTTVEALLDRDPVKVHADAPLPIASGILRRRAVRRLPVVDGSERLVGVISSDDLLRLVARELSGLAGAVAAQAPAAGGLTEWESEAGSPEVE